MFKFLIINYLLGFFAGFILEFLYRSIVAKKPVWPLLVNIQLYALSTTGIYLVSLLNLKIYLVIPLLITVTTGLELLIGLTYLKYKNIQLWDYTDQILHYKGVVAVSFSFYWLVLSFFYLVYVLPWTIGLAI